MKASESGNDLSAAWLRRMEVGRRIRGEGDMKKKPGLKVKSTSISKRNEKWSEELRCGGSACEEIKGRAILYIFRSDHPKWAIGGCWHFESA
jgi:hypothetical protein